MVVISIVGIISAVSLNSLTLIQKNNRDAQRQADLRLLQGALQQYYADANHYPDTLVLTGDSAFTCPTGCGSAAKTYLNMTPVDPTVGTATPYCYAAFKSSSLAGCTTGQCHYYQLNAKLDNSSSAPSYKCGASGATIYNFQVAPL
jgi:type II secretory pathway pseudopilin PulG